MDFSLTLPNLEQNKAIQKSLNYVFETDIKSSYRFFEALKYRTDEMTGIPPYGVWMSAMKIYPQIIEFMINKGFRFENIKWNRWPKVEKSNIIQDWVSSLQIMFSIAENEENFSQFSTLRDNQYITI